MGWTPKAALPLLFENQNSFVLNERGPALKVFWSRLWRDGRRAGVPECACASECVWLIECLTKKTRAGRSQTRSNPAASFGSKV